MRRWKVEAAIQYYTKAIDIDPEFGMHAGAGVAYDALNNPRCLTYLKRAIKCSYHS